MRKLALVTGGARGIGRACAHELAKSGYNLAIVDLLRPEMERTEGDLKELGYAASVKPRASPKLKGRAFIRAVNVQSTQPKSLR